MPLAVTHVILTIIFIDLFRDYIVNKKNKKLFTMHTIFIAGIGGLFPDIDIILRMLSEYLGFGVPTLLNHGGITHTPFFGLLFIIPGFLLWKMKKKKYAMYFFVISYGIFVHLFLDFFIGGGGYEGIMWFFPFSLQSYKIHILMFFDEALRSDLFVSLDAAILVLWLWHEEVKHKISDFI